MKMFKIYIGMIFVMIHGVSFAHRDMSLRTIAEYHNRITNANFSTQIDGSYTITLQFETSPICLSIPNSYEESLDNNIKSYFFPRVQPIDTKAMKFFKELDDIFELSDIEYQWNQISGKNFGFKIIFGIDFMKYQIKKIVDNDTKTVRFEIRLK